jgi:hypothetical protein
MSDWSALMNPSNTNQDSVCTLLYKYTIDISQPQFQFSLSSADKDMYLYKYSRLSVELGLEKP